MNNKYYGRTLSNISRDNSAIESNSKEPSWFSDYVDNLEKSAVKSKKEDYALFDQINGILGNKSKYSSVEEAVLDMSRRTGLLDFLNNKKQAQANLNNKYANCILFKEVPVLKTFIDNYVEDRPGTSVEAVVHDLLKIKSIKDNLPEADDVPVEVKKYISDKILDANSNNNIHQEDLQLGKADLSSDDNASTDNDPFGGCTPVVK